MKTLTKHPDCIHYGKGGWCNFRKGVNLDLTKNPPVKTYSRIRCSEAIRLGGECKFYKCDYDD